MKTQHTASDTEAAERVVDLLAGIPVVLPIKALNLEIGKTYQLLNSDEHSQLSEEE